MADYRVYRSEGSLPLVKQSAAAIEQKMRAFLI